MNADGGDRRVAKFVTATLLAMAAAGTLARAHGGGYPPPPPPPPPAGGTYSGPTDTTPGGGASGPATPAPSGPATPSPAAPAAPGQSAPGSTSGPSTGVGGPSTPGGAGGPATPDSFAIDWNSWEVWWNYNHRRWLYAREYRLRRETVTGSDEFFLGRGQRAEARDVIAPSQRKLATQMVPLLIESLQRERTPDVLSSALIALAKARNSCDLAGVDAEAAIAKLLTHDNLEVSETAAVALGVIGGRTNLGLLERLLAGDVEPLKAEHELSFSKGVPARTRAFAAFGLGIAGEELDGYHRLVIARALHRNLERELRARQTSNEVASACILALGLLPLPSHASDVAIAPERPPLLDSREAELRYLFALLDADALPKVVRASVPISLGRIASALAPASPLRAATVRRLLTLLGHRTTDDESRRSALLGLARTCGSSPELDLATYATLIELARSAADQQTRSFALIALGEASGNGHVDVDRDIAQAALIEVLARGAQEQRAWAALGLGLQQRLRLDRGLAQSPLALSAVRSHFQEARSAHVSSACAIALGLARDAAALPLIEAQLVRESDPRAKGHLCVALGMLEATGSAEKIAGIARGARFQPELLTFSCVALGLLADSTGIGTLIELLEQSSSLSTQAGLASALGRVGDTRAIEPLLAIANDRQRPALVRAFALVALGGIADDRQLPWNEPLATGINYRVPLPTLTSPVDSRGVLDIL